MRMYELVNVCVCVSLKPTIFELRVDLLNFKSKFTKKFVKSLTSKIGGSELDFEVGKNCVIFLGPLTNGFFWLVLWLSTEGQRREQRGRRKPTSAQPRPKFIDRQLAFVSCVFTNFFLSPVTKIQFILLSNNFSRQIVMLHGVVSCDLSWFDEIFWDYIFFICQIHFSALFWYTLTSLAHCQEREIQKSKQCDKCPDS